MDFAVDLRKSSPTYKKWVSVELSEENHRQLWIPAGFGHALLTLVDNCEVQYKVDEFYFPDYDRGIAWNDPEIGIGWGISTPIVSEKDANSPPLCKSDVNFESLNFMWRNASHRCGSAWKRDGQALDLKRWNSRRHGRNIQATNMPAI